MTIVGRTIITDPEGYKFVLITPTYEVTWTDLTIVIMSGIENYAWTTATEEGLTGPPLTTQALGPSCEIGGVTFFLNVTDVAGNGVISTGDYFTITGAFEPGRLYGVALIHEPTLCGMVYMTWTA